MFGGEISGVSVGSIYSVNIKDSVKNNKIVEPHVPSKVEHRTEGEELSLKPVKTDKNLPKGQLSLSDKNNSKISEKAVIISASAVIAGGVGFTLAEGIKVTRSMTLISEGVSKITSNTSSLNALKDLPITINEVKAGVSNINLGGVNIPATVGPGSIVKLNFASKENVALIENGILAAEKTIVSSVEGINSTVKAIDLAKSQIKFAKGGLYVLGAGVAIATVAGIAYASSNHESKTYTENDKTGVTKYTNKAAVAIAAGSVVTGTALTATGIKIAEKGIKLVETGMPQVQGGLTSLNNGIVAAKASVEQAKSITTSMGTTKELLELAQKAKSSNSKFAQMIGNALTNPKPKPSIMDNIIKGESVVAKGLGTISKGESVANKGTSLALKGAKYISTGAKVAAVGIAVGATIAVGGYVYSQMKD